MARYRYTYYYRTLFGYEFSFVEADDQESADRAFWEDRTRELYRIQRIVCQLIPEGEADKDAQEGDDGRPGAPACKAHQRLPHEVLPPGGGVEGGVVGDALPDDGRRRPGWRERVSKRVDHLFLKVFFGV